MPDISPRNIPLLELRNVVCHPADATLSRGISLRVEHGSIVGLLADTATDTGTLADCITGHHPVRGGSIRFNGQEIANRPAAHIARLGLLRTHRQPRLFSQMTCLENVLASSPRQHSGLLPLLTPASHAEHERAADLLALVGLRDMRQHRADHLSPARRTLLELAMALMAKPQLLLLDSPAASLAPTESDALADLLRRANAEMGIALLVVEHDADMALRLAEHVYALAASTVHASGPPEEVARHVHVGAIPANEPPMW